MQKYAVLITVLFALSVTVIGVSYSFWQFNKLNKQQYIDHIFTKYSVIIQIFRENVLQQSSDIALEANLAVYKLKLVKEREKLTTILKQAKLLKRRKFKSINTSLYLNKDRLYKQNTVIDIKISMLHYKKSIYFYVTSPTSSILVKDEDLKPYVATNILYTYATIITISVISFLLILQKLKPLMRLRRKIALFGNGNMDISFKTSSCDEIGSVANELENARQKINNLLEARTLFLRNIMHELKTPIAKGMIAVHMLKSPKQKDRFLSIFKRLESLVNEFAMIEEVRSLDSKENFSEYRVVDIIDGAIDMAMVSQDSVTVDVDSSKKIYANYRLYTTAIKNMIDNAMKYSTDGRIKIIMRGDELCFESLGEKMKHPLKYYIEPFTKDNLSKNSFGLGLYLVDSILQAHNQVLAYEYKDGVNCFIFV